LSKVVRVKSDIGKNLTVALKNLEGKVAKVGWFEKSRYPESPNIPVAYVAAIHEYGYPSKNIPARPFMRPTIAAKQTEWRSTVERGARAVLEGNATIENVMETIGQEAAGDIRKTISQIFSPPLKPATVAARVARYKNQSKIGSLTKPLIDTGLLNESLTNIVTDEKT
jgi:phage gpG-like protein